MRAVALLAQVAAQGLGVAVGQKLKADDEMLVVEAMKMEIPILADEGCEVVEVRCERGSAVSAGETLLVVKPLSVR